MLAEWILSLVVDNVFGYLLDQSGLGEAVRDRLRHDPVKRAFSEALLSTVTQFEKQHPEWVASLFNADFLKNEAAPILAQFLLRDGKPDPSELAIRWANSFNGLPSKQRTAQVRKLEPIAAEFLVSLGHKLKANPILREINDSRSLETIAGDMNAMRGQLDRITAELEAFRRLLDSDKATPGTQQDYLHWMIERTLYLDLRGAFQAQRQPQVRLDEIYISLRAQHEEMPGSVDRRILESELAELEARFTQAGLSPEELEEKREELLAYRALQLRNAGAKTRVLELAEVVSQHGKAVILGDPGSGKTTLLHYLALKHAQALQNGFTEASGDLGLARFPIAVRIADYAEYGLPRGKALSDFLVEDCLMHECPGEGLADLLATKLAQGDCLILLDGLDEIVSADDRRSVVHRIEEFVRRHDDVPNRFVISSRIAGYRSAPLSGPFAHYAVQEMNEMQIHRFLERWCHAVETVETPDLSPEAREVTSMREVESLMQAVTRAPGVRRLAANPLLLRILAQIHRTEAQLPQRRIGLYRSAAETLARPWRSAQGIPESALVKSEYLTSLLSKLAYWLHVNKSTSLATEREVYEVLGEEWSALHDEAWDPDAQNVRIREKVGAFLLQVREHTGLFVERAPQRYGFMHLTFEEYYAARYLVARSRTRARLLHQHLHDPRWEEPILLGLGFVGLESRVEAQELLETAILAESEEAQAFGLLPGPYEELLGWDYLFALRCLGDDIAVRRSVRQRLIKRLASELLDGSGLARFRRYWQALEERLQYLGGSAAMVELISILNTRLNGSSFLVRYWSHEVTQGVMSVPPELCDVLVTAFRRESDPQLRAYIALILSQCSLRSPELRAEVLKAQEAIFLPPSTLTTDEDPPYQKKRKRGGSLREIRKQLVAEQITLLQDHDAGVRMRAARDLGYEMPEFPAASKALVAALVHDESAAVRSRAARSLGYIRKGTPEIFSALLSALHGDSSALVRANTAWSLGQVGAAAPDVQTALLSALHDDPDPTVRASAVCGLAKDTVSSEMIMALIEGLSASKNMFVREQGAEILGEWGQVDEPIIQVLLRGLLDGNGYVRIACAQGFVRLGQRFPAQAEMIENRLVQAIADPAFELVDTTGADDNYVTRRPAYDYAYDALWQFVVNRRSSKNN